MGKTLPVPRPSHRRRAHPVCASVTGGTVAGRHFPYRSGRVRHGTRLGRRVDLFRDGRRRRRPAGGNVTEARVRLPRGPGRNSCSAIVIPRRHGSQDRIGGPDRFVSRRYDRPGLPDHVRHAMSRTPSPRPLQPSKCRIKACLLRRAAGTPVRAYPGGPGDPECTVPLHGVLLNMWRQAFRPIAHPRTIDPDGSRHGVRNGLSEGRELRLGRPVPDPVRWVLG